MKMPLSVRMVPAMGDPESLGMFAKIGKLTTSAVLLATATGTALGDPLSDLLQKRGGSVCYTRAYDKAHLDKHPEQTTTEIRVSLVADERDGGGAVIRVMLKSRQDTSYIAGTCDWAEKANLDVNGNPIIEAFKGPSGLNCWALTSADGSSAEEGGNFFVDLKDGKTVNLYLPEYIAAWPSFDRSDNAAFLELGAEDQVFRLDKAAAGSCEEMVEKLPWLL
jgi:hypothetical protein